MKIEEKMKKAAGPLIAIIAALIIGGIIIAMCGYDFVKAYGALMKGSFADFTHICETLVRATPLIFTALSYSIADKCGIINLGAEGQLYIGALFAAMIGTMDFGLVFPFHLLLTLTAAFIASGLYGMLAIWLKNKFGASELITTIMLNYIATYMVNFFVTGPMKDPESTFTQSQKIVASSLLVRIPGMGRLHIGFLLAVLFVAAYYLYFKKTVSGFQMRVVGHSYDAARYAGLNYKKLSLKAMFLAGGVAGMAGCCEVLGIQGKLVQNFSSGLGFNGIAVALLGNENPAGMVLAGILFGGLQSGSGMMQMRAGVPSALINIIQAIIILMIAGQKNIMRAFAKIQVRSGRRER